ncbi:fimbrial protein [Burkholderia cepacia]|uniref:fimbrial protein n=1 Tax=Burkholderia cepacia TaxID=292 RepID=UPI001C934052|nr:fimbrial protein [Burkholderia cepacia]MBY4710249.1 type 1 fimbrial protein [Burkholderia cepacia]MBY4737294.1 type 1 fimbrial protein [Burkholderia cepacia]MBY4742577.1 type 1 fimbrial protein [Burkholderia cepacia]MBY4760997.1 type 1 fimbrial protein [Burkholderia cepacia]MBY4777682.1 type 1 fimbrial protein [Burkholderia cepacia]
MNFKKIGKILIPISLGAASMPSMANSVCYNDIAGGGTSTIYLDGYIAPEFSPDTPLGTVIDSRTLPLEGTVVTVTCPQSSGINNTVSGRWTKPEPTYNTFPTSASGIGVRIRFPNQGWWNQSFTSNQKTIKSAATSIEIEFVKTGTISAQTSITGEIGAFWVDNYGFKVVSYQVRGSIQIKPRVPTCSVATKLISVSMTPTGSMSSHDFSGVGSTSPQRDFSILLNCSGGDKNTSTNAYVTLTDQTNNLNQSNQLSLTKDSTATGLKVQILKDGKPLNYGPDSSEAGNVNQWKAGNIPQGQGAFSIPLTARYIQTGTVKAGTANAVATFTMSYQ